ncbi:MAG: sialidase family protein, partial [Actinomycetota bacterium]
MRARSLSLGIVLSVLGGLFVAPAGHAAGTATRYYFHAVNAPVQSADLVTGGATFDSTPPQFTDDAYATDVPEAGNGNGKAVYDPGWTGKVDGPIDSLSLDFWSKATAGEALGEVDYDAVVWVGATEYDLPTLTVKNVDPTAFNEIKGTFTTMLDADGNEVPLSIDPAGQDLSINIRGTFVVDEAGATIAYDSTAHPSNFTVTTGAAPSPSSTASTPSPTPTQTTSSGGSGSPQSLSGSISFGPPVELPASASSGSWSTTCNNPCGEPSLVQAPDGTMYISTPRAIGGTKSSPVWKSTDRGATWSNPIFPVSTVPGGEALSGGDTEMAVDGNNTLYEGDLWLGNDSMFITSDQGKTWTSTPVSHDVVDDREWVVYNQKDDALYGWYDGSKGGLEVIRAPLNTPLGSKAGLFAPQETVAVPARPVCVVVVCLNVSTNAIPNEANGVPIIERQESPGIPAVDPISGTVYFPFGYQVPGKGVGIAETTDGLNFTYDYVPGAGHGAIEDVDNDFPVAAVDSAGTLYIAWVEDKGTPTNPAFHLYFSSKKQGGNWVGPTDVSGAISKTAVFPTMAAGADGRVVLGWYGTDVAGNNNDENALGNASWNVYVAESTNASSAAPTFDQLENVDPNFHTGTISTGGLGGTADRSLLDFFTVGIDNESGNADVTYTRDKGEGTAIMFAKQNGGCDMLTTDPCAAPSPSPSSSSAPSPSSSPSPTAQGTTLTFTSNVPASGQFTDQVPLGAQLKDSSGNPLP